MPGSDAAAAPSLGALRVGGVPEHFNRPWHAALQQGRFAAGGVALSFTAFGGGTGAMLAAVAAREIDVAVALTEGILAAVVSHN